jgi:hypothetical protein
MIDRPRKVVGSGLTEKAKGRLQRRRFYIILRA